jgi:erythromycin esterase
MAENVQWILNFEGRSNRMIVWAHNRHIQKRFHSEFVAHSLGYYLSQMFDEEFYSLGFDFNKGGFIAIDEGLQVHKVGDAKARSTGSIFAQCEISQFFFDFKLASLNPDMKIFLNKKLKSRSIGSYFKPSKEKSYYLTGPLNDLYDGLIFLNQVSSAKLLWPLEKDNQ